MDIYYYYYYYHVSIIGFHSQEIYKYCLTHREVNKIICLTSLTRAKPKEKMEFPA